MTGQLALLEDPDPNEDLIGYRWAGSGWSFVVTGTSAQPTYVDVTATRDRDGRVLLTCRAVGLVRQHKLGLWS